MKNLRWNKILALLGILLIGLPMFFGLLFGTYLYFKKPQGTTQNIEWGATFSHTFAQDLGLDWKATYIDMLDNLNVKYLRIPVYWTQIEKESGKLDFSDYDFMISEAEKRDMKLTLVVGTKVPRWPECHVPGWAKDLSEKDRQDKLMHFIGNVVMRYHNAKSIYYWQVENEPFLPFFGECSLPNSINLDSEIKLVSILDEEKHPIVVTDSGELGSWLFAAYRGNVFGTTMYKNVWSKTLSPYLGYISYPINHHFFWFKANLLHIFYPNKKIIISELQAEPWANISLALLPLSEQKKTMDIQKFKANIELAKKTGFSEAYLWGVEWWYFMKDKQNDPSFFNEAKKLFSQNSNY